MMQDPVKSPNVLQIKIWNNKIMYPRYIYDRGLTKNLPKEFYQWWKNYYVYPDSNVADVKIQLIPTTSHTLEHYFIKKKPEKELLTKMESSTT
jgi:hypothetical protein